MSECECRYPNSCETCWPSVSKAEVDRVARETIVSPNQPSGNNSDQAVREWTVKRTEFEWLLLKSPLDYFPAGRQLLVERAAYIKVCAERDEARGKVRYWEEHHMECHDKQRREVQLMNVRIALLTLKLERAREALEMLATGRKGAESVALEVLAEIEGME